MSDTPRTDAAQFTVIYQTSQENVVGAPFARSLERENADLLAALKELLAASERRVKGGECKAERDAARAAIARHSHE